MTAVLRVVVALALLAVFAPAAQAMEFSPWTPAVNAEDLPGTSDELNTAFQDGCPIQAPDGLSLFMASTRPRFAGDTRTDIDIWVAERESTDAPWGARRTWAHQSTPPLTTSVPRRSEARGCSSSAGGYCPA
jgi:hypothetical protein